MPDIPIIGDRSPMHLSSPMTHPDAPDFIYDDVRARFLAFVRAMALGSKDIRVDATPVVIPGPQGASAQCLLLVSITNPVIGAPRLIASAATQVMEPPDPMLQAIAENLYNDVLDQAAEARRLPT